MHAIPATWEAEPGRCRIPAQAELEIPYLKSKYKQKDKRAESSSVEECLPSM
jgi:hypothetical protein